MANLNLIVRFTKQEWNEFTNNREFITTRGSKSRPRNTFLASFTQCLNEKIRAMGINLNLKMLIIAK